MRRLMESWNIYLREDEDMNRVSKAVMIGDVEEYNNGKVLILKRARHLVTKDSPWTWDLPGGHIQEEETEAAALSREVEEETGLRPLIVPSWYLLSKSTRFFVVQDWTGSFRLSDEHEDYEWIDPSEASQYNLGKMYINAIKVAFEGV